MPTQRLDQRLERKVEVGATQLLPVEIILKLPCKLAAAATLPHRVVLTRKPRCRQQAAVATRLPLEALVLILKRLPCKSRCGDDSRMEPVEPPPPETRMRKCSSRCKTERVDSRPPPKWTSRASLFPRAALAAGPAPSKFECVACQTPEVSEDFGSLKSGFQREIEFRCRPAS